MLDLIIGAYGKSQVALADFAKAVLAQAYGVMTRIGGMMYVLAGLVMSGLFWSST